MKRLMSWILIAMTLALALPAGAASFSPSKAAIKYGSTVYRIGQTSTNWKKNLGRYTRKLNDTNGSLISYTYTFKTRGVKVTTLYSTKLSKEKIVSILVVGKSITTASGLKVGQTGSVMARLYGKKFAKKGSYYTYKSGSRRLQVRASKGRVAAFKIS